MKKILHIFFLVSVSLALHAQKNTTPLSVDTLARVGGSVITERDLIERIELMPWEGKEQPASHDSSKIKALNSLIAERLLANEGKHLNIGSDEPTALRIREMEKLFVRDELFKREVTKKVIVTDREINEGLAKFAWQIHAIAIAVKSQAEGDSLVRMLNNNIAVATIVNRIRPSYITAVETVQVNFGGLDTLFENAVYSIDKKKFSKLFVSNTYGWTVAIILDRGTNPVYAKMNSGDRRIRVHETIRRKKEEIAAARYFAKIMSPQKAVTDSALFFLLARELRKLMVEDSVRHKNKDLYAVIPADVDQLITLFQASLQKPFIVLPGKPFFLGEAFEAMKNHRMGFPSLDEYSFIRTLNYHLRTAVESELMSREGYRQRLNFSESVRHDLKTWSDYWISRSLILNVRDSVSVSDDEILEGLRSSIPFIGTLYEVNIQEVLCDSLTTALKVLDEYAKGAVLSDLAKAYSQRTEWKDRGGISHFIPIHTYSEVTVPAFLADTGTVVGPVITSKGYSLFKVLGKRSKGPSSMPTADSITINIKNNLLEKKRSKSLQSYVAHLAKNYTIDIDYKKLSRLKILPANMYTRRMIGFGGVILAVPMLTPNWEWMNEYRTTEKQLP